MCFASYSKALHTSTWFFCLRILRNVFNYFWILVWKNLLSLLWPRIFEIILKNSSKFLKMFDNSCHSNVYKAFTVLEASYLNLAVISSVNWLAWLLMFPSRVVADHCWFFRSLLVNSVKTDYVIEESVANPAKMIQTFRELCKLLNSQTKEQPLHQPLSIRFPPLSGYF